jgi:hypothetical protein
VYPYRQLIKNSLPSIMLAHPWCSGGFEHGNFNRLQAITTGLLRG